MPILSDIGCTELGGAGVVDEIGVPVSPGAMDLHGGSEVVRVVTREVGPSAPFPVVECEGLQNPFQDDKNKHGVEDVTVDPLDSLKKPALIVVGENLNCIDCIFVVVRTGRLYSL